MTQLEPSPEMNPQEIQALLDRVRVMPTMEIPQPPSVQPERSLDKQIRILVSRYYDCLLGDAWTVLLLLAQAPFIGYLCTIVWKSVNSDTNSLYFVMALSAVWFGCINACREIVKERSILERERLFGLSISAYAWSKFEVLAFLGLAQVLLLQTVIEMKLGVKGPFIAQTLALWGASLCGTGLGLLVSALSSSQERAVGAMPLLLLPQILFSEFAIRREEFSSTVKWIERFMPVKWSYRIFKEVAKTEPAWMEVVGSLFILIFYAFALLWLSVAALLRRRDTV